MAVTYKTFQDACNARKKVAKLYANGSETLVIEIVRGFLGEGWGIASYSASGKFCGYY